MNFEEVYENYLKYAEKRHKKQSFNVLQYNFNANILAYFKGKKLQDITTADIISWQDFILERDFCNNHNKNLFCMLKNFFNFCKLYYGFDYSIIEKVNSFPRKIEKKKYDFYNLSEFNKFIKCVKHPVYKQFFNLMFFTGTRPGEAMALKFSDLRAKLDAFYIKIDKSIDEHGKRLLGTPKTISSIREVSVDKKLYYDLLDLKKYYIKIYGEFSFDYFIFGGQKPLSPTTINRYKLNACNKANLRPITLHQFRHSHATLLFNRGISIHEIANRLGHAKVSTTFDVYTHSYLSQEKRVLKTLNSMRFNFFNVLQYNFKNFISLLKH